MALLIGRRVAADVYAILWFSVIELYEELNRLHSGRHSLCCSGTLMNCSRHAGNRPTTLDGAQLCGYPSVRRRREEVEHPELR